MSNIQWYEFIGMCVVFPASFIGSIWLVSHIINSTETGGEIQRLHDKLSSLRLTPKEQEAIEDCIRDDEVATAYDRADTLRGLLDRLRGT